MGRGKSFSAMLVFGLLMLLMPAVPACGFDEAPDVRTTVTLGPSASVAVSTASTVGATTTTSLAAVPMADLTGSFPADIASAGATIHSRSVITREGQRVPVIVDFWWQVPSTDYPDGRYRIERRFGASPAQADAQVFSGTHWTGFVATGANRYAFDMSYEESQELNETIDPVLIVGMEPARVEWAGQLVESGELEEIDRKQVDGRVVIRYLGSVAPGNEGGGLGVAAPTRDVFVDERTGLVVEESVAEGDRVLYRATRDYEVVDADEFESLMALGIPPGYGPSSSGGAGQGRIYPALGPEACGVALAELREWLPFTPYYLGDTFVDADGRCLTAREVRTTSAGEGWSSLLPGLEEVGGLGDGPGAPPLGCSVWYLSENANQDGKSMTVVMQDPALTGDGSGYPLDFWEKDRELKVGKCTDALYRVEQHYIYLARREAVVIALISDMDEEGVLAAARALRPFEGAAP